VALLEIVSPRDQDRKLSLAPFVDLATSALRKGHPLLIAVVFPPGPHDRQEIPGAVWAEFDGIEAAQYRQSCEKPLTLVAYATKPAPERLRAADRRASHAAEHAAVPYRHLGMSTSRWKTLRASLARRSGPLAPSDRGGLTGRSPQDKLQGKEREIFAGRDSKLAEIRKRRRCQRQACHGNRQAASTTTPSRRPIDFVALRALIAIASGRELLGLRHPRSGQRLPAGRLRPP